MRTKGTDLADGPQNTLNGSPSYGATLDLNVLGQALVRQFWVVVLTVVVITGATIGFSLAQPPRYEASIKVIVGQGGKLTQDPVAQAGLMDITDTMVVAVDTLPVAQSVVQKLGLDETPKEVLKNTSAQRVGATQFIEVSYTDSDPERAKRVANTIGSVFSDEIAGISPGSDAITASVWEPATVPTSPEDPDPIRNGFLALVFGAMLGVGLALLLDYLSTPGKRKKASRGFRSEY
jgi:capsular polysaccharide biosynthesis protein